MIPAGRTITSVKLGSSKPPRFRLILFHSPPKKTLSSNTGQDENS